MYEPLLDNRLPKFVEYTARRLPKCRPVIHSNGDFLTLETFRQYIECGLYIFRITQHDSRMPTNLQQILDEASETERKHIDIQFSNAMYLVNRSGLIPTFKLPAKPLEVACDWPLTTLVITMGGDVVPCCNDYFCTEVVGNVKTSSVRDVWCGEHFECFRTALSKGDRTASKLCVTCDYVPNPSDLRRIVAQ